MKCPNCGSERIQFGTNTSGRGYSAGDGCCGFILLGPIGLLCGACGSDVKTDEFWICQDCGNKFTTNEAKKLQKMEEDAKRNYEQSKRDSEKALAEYGSKDAIHHLLAEADRKKYEKISAFNVYVEKYVEANFSDPNISKWLKMIDSVYSKIEVGIGIVLAILTLLAFLGGVTAAGISGAVLIAILICARPAVSVLYNRKLIRYLAEKDSKIRKLYYETKEAEKESEKYCTILSKIDSCEEYEKNAKK